MDRICTAAPAMNTADIMLPENARSVISGHSGLASTAGICTIAVNGVKMKPIAARCGSRLNSTDWAAETRDSASPRMKPLCTCSQYPTPR
jgi:hypothetical protein